jgi:aspartyl-tRNA(Asn)/glutamyl-tRNA(Gln) amidotransferase subunit C
MKIDRTEAGRIAALARLEFDDAGLDRMAAEMTAILEYIDQLRSVDVSGVEAVIDDAPTPLRPDVPHQSLDREAAERNAPQFRDGFFVVPPIIGGES